MYFSTTICQQLSLVIEDTVESSCLDSRKLSQSLHINHPDKLPTACDLNPGTCFYSSTCGR